ncbi:MAG: MarR family transcriptional regulator [Spirochaetia bacterium]|nr:MarR family transcriptional regulator [Spirochaetia bacterium]
MVKWKEVTHSVGYKIYKTNGLLRNLFQKTIHESGSDLTPEQWGIINYLKFNPGVTQTKIVQVSGRDQTSITRMLDGLQKKKLIERKKDDDDRRVFRIYLTVSGKKMYNLILPYSKKYNDRLNGMFSEAERKKLFELLDRLSSLRGIS